MSPGRRTMLQLRKAKKRRRGCAQRQLDGAETFFDLLHGLLLAHFLAVQVRMRPSMGADAMAGRRHLFENFGMVGRVLADREEHRLGAFIRERFEHGGRVYRPGTVVEGQHDFLVRQEVELLEMLEAETWPAGSVDFHDAADTECIRIGARGLWLRRNGRLCRNGSGDLNILGYRDWFGGSGPCKPLGWRGTEGRSNRQISTRGRCPKPYGRDHNRGPHTRQHQT